MYFSVLGYIESIPVDERSKARVCGRSLAGTAGSNPAGSMDVSVVLCVLYSKDKGQRPRKSRQRNKYG